MGRGRAEVAWNSELGINGRTISVIFTSAVGKIPANDVFHLIIIKA
jgi:hypothetical protein